MNVGKNVDIDSNDSDDDGSNDDDENNPPKKCYTNWKVANQLQTPSMTKDKANQHQSESKAKTEARQDTKGQINAVMKKHDLLNSKSWTSGCHK